MMSLSSLLLHSTQGKSQHVDKGLDAIFSATVPPPSTEPGPSSPGNRKRKKHAQDVPASSKKSKVVQDASEQDETRPSTVKGEAAAVTHTTKHGKKHKKAKSSKAVTAAEVINETDEAGSHPASGRLANEDVSGDSEAEDPQQPLVHESLMAHNDGRSTAGRNAGSESRSKKVKYAPSDETPQQRDSRTVFVGNVPSETAKSKPLLKQFKRHILSFVPNAQIESVRFRSIAFQKPTTKLPTDEDDTGKKPPIQQKEKEKQPRQHDVARATSWRESNAPEAGTVAAEKKYLTPQEKKRVAFIKHDFHEGVDVVTSYVVFAHPQPPHTRAANVPAPAPVLDPYEAARSAVEKCDGSTFNQKTLRVDHVKNNTKSLGGSSGVNSDPKLTVFVGNLDFASKEEDLRAFFESLISKERGPRQQEPAETNEDDVEGDEPSSSTWVTRVRLIRDKDTQLGKGFAYVQFVDRECVDEILALEHDKIKFAKRKLRVQRCKSLPGEKPSGSGAKAASKTTRIISTRPKPTPVSIPHVPKGDPNLGKQLEHLSKEERKQRKASDAERVARRLAKKQVKAVMEKAGVKAKTRERERTRRRADPKKKALPKPKRRVRSETNLRNRNLKK